MAKVVNLDAHSGTRIDPEVLETVCRVLAESQANSASDHALGAKASAIVEESRAEVAALLRAHPDEIVFTPGATEAINLGIRGFLHYRRSRLGPSSGVVTSRLEHRAVLESVEQARIDFGVRPVIVEAGIGGRIEPQAIQAVLHEPIEMICLSHANGEVGTINPVVAIGDAIKASSKAAFLVDASQSVAYLPIDLSSLAAELVVVSSHKMHGPKGVAALFVRRGVSLDPILGGGGQERGLWPGTQNQALIAGFGVAARLTRERREVRSAKVRRLRDAFWERLRTSTPELRLNGHSEDRLPGNLSITISGVAAIRLRSIGSLALSAGSACTSRRREPSHVLKALGLTEGEAGCTIRIGFSEDLALAEVLESADVLITEIQRIRGRSRSR